MVKTKKEEAMKRVVCLSVLSLFVFGVVSILPAADMCGGNTCSNQAQAADNSAAAKNAVDVGNTICPVTGEKIDEKTKETYVYEGKIYNFCCPMCVPKFKKEPEKYIKKIEEEKAKQ